MSGPKLGRKLIKSMGGKNYLLKRPRAGDYIEGVWVENDPENYTEAILFNDNTATIQAKLRAVAGLEGVVVYGTIIAGLFQVEFPLGANPDTDFITTQRNTTECDVSVSRIQVGTESVKEIQEITIEPEPEAGQLIFSFGLVPPIYIMASIQPITGKELVRVPEGDRNRERKVAYCADLLTTAEPGTPGSKADVITVEDVDFQVESIEPWPSYYKAVLVKINESEAT